MAVKDVQGDRRAMDNEGRLPHVVQQWITMVAADLPWKASAADKGEAPATEEDALCKTRASGTTTMMGTDRQRTTLDHPGAA